MTSLQKKATDALVQQLLERIGDCRVVAPGARVNVLDSVYVGRLRDLLAAAFPGTPPDLFHHVRHDLIVLQRDLSPPTTSLVRFDESRLRVPKLTAAKREALERYSPLTGARVEAGKHLDADLFDCALVFDRRFFDRRSIVGWAKLALQLARMTAAWGELKRESGLRQHYVESHGHLVPARLVETVDGDEIEVDW